MAKITVSAKEILADIKAGMDDSTLMEKHQLTDKGLQSLFKKLLDSGLLKQTELEKRTPLSERSGEAAWNCSACGKSQTEQADIHPDCGVVLSKLGAKQESEEAPSGTVVEKETGDTVESPQSPTLPQDPTTEPEKQPALPLIPAQPSRFKEFLRTRKLYIAVASIWILAMVVVLLQPKRLDPLWTEPLMQASYEGHVDVVEQLLAKGADINAKDKKGRTVLMFASLGGHVDVVEQLLAKGADINAKDNYGWTALTTASSGDHVDVVKLLLSKGADINAKDKEICWTALTWASSEGHVDVVKRLLAKGADINAKDEEGWTALMLASLGGHVDVVEQLLAKGADINAKDKENGWTALMFASSKGHQEVVNLLKAHGAQE